jgi:exonuclease III
MPTLTPNISRMATAGDFNVMPADLDVYRPERWVDDALFRPEVREAWSMAPMRLSILSCSRDLGR